MQSIKGSMFSRVQSSAGRKYVTFISLFIPKDATIFYCLSLFAPCSFCGCNFANFPPTGSINVCLCTSSVDFQQGSQWWNTRFWMLGPCDVTKGGGQVIYRRLAVLNMYKTSVWPGELMCSIREIELGVTSGSKMWASQGTLSLPGEPKRLKSRSDSHSSVWISAGCWINSNQKPGFFFFPTYLYLVGFNVEGIALQHSRNDWPPIKV